MCIGSYNNGFILFPVYRKTPLYTASFSYFRRGNCFEEVGIVKSSVISAMPEVRFTVFGRRESQYLGFDKEQRIMIVTQVN